MTSEQKILIQQLHQIVKLLSDLKKEESLTKEDWKIYSVAENYFGEKYFFKKSYSKFLKNLPISAVTDYINSLEKEKEEEQEKPKEQEASIPPELEALVAEYRQNQALLESEEIKSNSQRSVAEQVKIAIAYKNRSDLILANKQRRLGKGEKFRDPDEVLVSFGSPKSSSKTAALATSYKAVQEVAFNNDSFSKLSLETQNKIIDEAVNLNLRCVTNIDVAIQSAALLINNSDIPSEDRQEIANVSSNYIRSVYDAVNTQTKQAATFQAQIDENGVVLLQLEKESQVLSGKALEIKLLQIKSLVENNRLLTNKLNNLPGQFEVFNKNQLPDYQKFERESQIRLSKDPDTKDRIELANKKIESLQNNLENNGVKPHIYTPVDDAQLLEQAIRQDMPGVLLPFASYEAQEAAALISHPKTQDPNLSPLAVLLYSKELTPTLLAKAHRFALKNPDSVLGKLLKTRKDLFDSAGSQLGKIASSPLGKEISKASTGIGKVFKPVSGFFGKISDKIGAFSSTLGSVARVIQNPWGALRSWAGHKAGEQFIRIIKNKVSKAVLNKIPNVLLQGGIAGAKTFVKEALVKLAVKGITWAAVKLGISLTAESLNAIMPGLGLIVDIAIQVVLWIGEKTIGYAKKVFDNVSVAVYGEKIKARDLVAIPVAGVAAAVGGIITFFEALGTATVAAAGSAVAITVAGTIIGVFFYITSIVVAPLISTLVQLESASQINMVTGCAAWPTAGEYLVLQGPLGVATHALSSLQAIDIGAEENTGFLAAAPGQVIFSAPLGTYGNAVIVAANTSIGTIDMLYAHMNDVNVTVGQLVNVGDTIGSVGGTGGWSPHIHFEYRDGTAYNSCPAGDIPVPEGCNGANCLYKGQLIITNVTTP